MYDAGKVITGIVVFVGLVTLPIWYTFAAGDPSHRPEIKRAQGTCVEETAFMRANHMDLLNQWRDRVVRDGERVYTGSDGRQHWMSLSFDGNVPGQSVRSKSCMSCHDDKQKFCDECHDYVGATPNCFDCHVEPRREHAL